MEGAAQPTRIAGPRPRRRGPLQGARDRVLDGACGSFYYRVTTVVQDLVFLGLFWRSGRDLNPAHAGRDHQSSWDPAVTTQACVDTESRLIPPATSLSHVVWQPRGSENCLKTTFKFMFPSVAARLGEIVLALTR